MMRTAPLLLLLLGACVLDRTGQSATSAYERELALQKNHAAEMERLVNELDRRLSQLEEVTRYRGQQEAAKMENLDQVRQEVQRLRGELELLSHQGEEAATFRDDAGFRVDYAELRIAQLEAALGLEAPPPPLGDAQAVAGGGAAVGEEVEVPSSGPLELPELGENASEVTLPETPDEILALAESHLSQDRPAAARAVLDRYITENPEAERMAEARYRYAETYFNEGSYQQAILRFEDAIGEAPTSPWAAWAMVRQGECFKAMGKDQEAELFWQDVVARYPKSKAAKEARALLGR